MTPTPALFPDLLDRLRQALPQDHERATLLGRLWLPGSGALPVTPHQGRLLDLTPLAPTCSELLERPQPAQAIAQAVAAGALRAVADLATVLANSDEDRRQPGQPWLLAPCDLQAIKASGVTFVASLLERVIEEQARGEPARAAALRSELHGILGTDLGAIVPGSPEAAEVKRVLLARGAWSQYLEVGIGPDAEIFTKVPVLSAVGCGAHVGIHPRSEWNNPEPEIVLTVNSQGRTLGAALGNDVNLRDFEGRSALLLGKAKDNNGSCAIGPFIRLFDAHFGIDDLRACSLRLEVDGPDGFAWQGEGSMRGISRDPLDLVAQTINANHQYPDGFMLFLGTMLAPTQDRRGAGQGFTHEVGDRVCVSTPALGTLVNRVRHSCDVAPWTFGIAALMRQLRHAA
ncbi:MAG: fumarylacetoacetate hydrolase [Burkholderiales bacterium RIFCSPHIGHO2_12_FULL_67_38]|nr:MAG: fumarylacetoacetate hydrolase [Burkholderiales bacterium RIFCSPLOWO2_02_FULL_67_64]OGB50753.1 MAG: fumarylacetoacetate hydrolase [Burkholderiales bacterium RIFCSPHIGHO2_12_FULL_67_38]